jgi:Clustered mitochondria/Translation initiation factor eIF3 subunit 135
MQNNYTGGYRIELQKHYLRGFTPSSVGRRKSLSSPSSSSGSPGSRLDSPQVGSTTPVSGGSGGKEESGYGCDDVYDEDGGTPEEQTKLELILWVQRKWRQIQAKHLHRALHQSEACQRYIAKHPLQLHPSTFEPLHSPLPHRCINCARGDLKTSHAELQERKRYKDINRLLFANTARIIVNDDGENWNARFIEALSKDDPSYLYALHRDFVSAASLYAKIIISEYFLHIKDKSIKPFELAGGIAGGIKYIWRGMLFKLADGSIGPWANSDENAAKAAGHDLKGVQAYFRCGALRDYGIVTPLMVLIDYKGFRMTAAAYLPLMRLIYGSKNAGVTVVNRCQAFHDSMGAMASTLNLREHIVGSRGRGVPLYSAADIEGHEGSDGRFYLIDLARAFPPEAPTQTPHLFARIATGSKVDVSHVMRSEVDGKLVRNQVTGAVVEQYEGGDRYRVRLASGALLKNIPASQIQRKGVTIFHRLLRPEYVKNRGAELIPLDELCRPRYGNLESAMVGIPEVTLSDATSASDDMPYGEFEILSPLDLSISAGTGMGTRGDLRDGAAKAAVMIDKVQTAEGRPFVDHVVPANYSAQAEYGGDDAGDYGYSYDLITGAGAIGDARVDAEPDDHMPHSLEPPATAAPLSPDALSKFSRLDPNAYDRNLEIRDATERLVKRVIPALARHLSLANENEIELFTQSPSRYLHSFGVNMRHCGLLRSFVPVECEALRRTLLIEIVSRTLKQMLRDFQRRWMVNERSSSDYGLHLTIVQFLNLVTGSHGNSAAFWTTRVAHAAVERFGEIGFRYGELADLLRISREPHLLTVSGDVFYWPIARH